MGATCIELFCAYSAGTSGAKSAEHSGLAPETVVHPCRHDGWGASKPCSHSSRTSSRSVGARGGIGSHRPYRQL